MGENYFPTWKERTTGMTLFSELDSHTVSEGGAFSERPFTKFSSLRASIFSEKYSLKGGARGIKALRLGWPHVQTRGLIIK